MHDKPDSGAAQYVVILKERTLVGKTTQYLFIHMFLRVEDALEFINGTRLLESWALFQAVELEEVTTTKIILKK